MMPETVDAAQPLIVPEEEMASVKELAFAFERAASRLFEVSDSDMHSATNKPSIKAHSTMPMIH